MSSDCDNEKTVIVNDVSECEVKLISGKIIAVQPKITDEIGVCLPEQVRVDISNNITHDIIQLSGDNHITLEQCPDNNIEISITEVPDVTIEMEGGSGIPDAPHDGNLYARRDGSWEVIVGSGVTPNHIELDFDYRHLPSSLEIGSAIPPQKIQNTVLEIIEPFDNDLGITVGTMTAQALLMTLTENSPDVSGDYYVQNNLAVAGTDKFRVFFTYPGTAPTQGRGKVTIYFN